MRIVVTGARGLLGWHSAARLHAANCGARFRGDAPPYDLVCLDHQAFADPQKLAAAVTGADAVLHFAGVNRAPEAEVEAANPAIARALVEACRVAGADPHIVYANSVQSRLDNVYGRSKQRAADILAQGVARMTDLVLPHIFGECARPDYNNVTATLIDRLWKGETPQINPQGRVHLLHAGAAATLAIDAVRTGRTGLLEPAGRDMSIQALFDQLSAFHASYAADIFPAFADAFELALFNSYRTGGFPLHYPKAIRVNADHRGVLFETGKGLGASQSFMSTLLPGKMRGDHFHTDLIERFLVVSGRAAIRIRRVLTSEVHEFHVDGATPVAIDMPPLHTHHIETAGNEPVLTFFWSHRLFDPANPDTYADPVRQEAA